MHGLNYSRFMNGVSLAGIELDRKILAELAVADAEAFGLIAQMSKDAIDSAAKAA